uniref:Uncharacterized protein n=1 Tax=Globodera rostochiensis TaxID=31243 RepID=A0A914HTB8_GLORO
MQLIYLPSIFLSIARTKSGCQQTMRFNVFKSFVWMCATNFRGFSFISLNLSNSELVDSSLAAKLNAFFGGDFTDFDVLRQLQTEHGLSDDVTNIVEGFAELMNMKKTFAAVCDAEGWRHFAKMAKYDEAETRFVQAMENSQIQWSAKCFKHFQSDFRF